DYRGLEEVTRRRPLRRLRQPGDAWRHGQAVRRGHEAAAGLTLPDSAPEPRTGQPVGPLVDATPARLPGPVVLQGRFGRLEKVAAHHGDDLWNAGAGEDRIWTYVT